MKHFETSSGCVIRAEARQDVQSIWRVHQAAFGGVVEPDLVNALRDGGLVEVSLVAEIDDQIVGHILFSSVSIITDFSTIQAASLAPMAVMPDYQRHGIGGRLALAGLDACQAKGHGIAVVLGHPKFYARFGFSAELAKPLQSPFGGGEAWMALELLPGALAGIEGKVEYPAAFGVFERREG